MFDMERLVAGGAAVQQQMPVNRTCRHERQPPSQPQIRPLVGSEAMRTKLLTETARTALTTGGWKPWQLIQAVVMAIDRTRPTAEGGLIEDVEILPRSIGGSFQQMRIGMTIEIALSTIRSGLKRLKKFARPQTVGRSSTGKPRREGLVLLQNRSTWPASVRPHRHPAFITAFPARINGMGFDVCSIGARSRGLGTCPDHQPKKNGTYLGKTFAKSLGSAMLPRPRPGLICVRVTFPSIETDLVVTNHQN